MNASRRPRTVAASRTVRSLAVPRTARLPTTGRLAAGLRTAALSVVLACAFATPGAIAQDAGPTAGTYMLEGGSYTITLDTEGGDIVVREPNKTSNYVRQADGSYHFYNPNTDTVYGLRVVDARTIEAFKPFVDGNVPSRLVLMGGGSGEVVTSPDSERYEALAQHYASLAENDPDNAQVWVACSGAALKRSISTGAEADAYAAQMAQMLQLMMDDGSGTPCADAIPSSVW